MNFKKFISGVSALTIAASAFAGMAVTASASTTYTLPANTKVGDVFVGSLNGDGSVSPETFTGYSNDDLAKWTIPGKYASSVKLRSVEEVAKPEIGSVCGENVYPTYVSGNVIDYYLREGSSNGRMWALYNFNDVNASNAKKLVFSADMWAQYTSDTYYLAFFDAENEPTAENKNGGTPLLELSWINGAGLQYYRYSVNGTTTTTNSNDTRSTWRTYRGYGVSDLEIDLATGAVEFYVDCIADRYSAERKRTKITANIGTGKTISSFGIGRAAVSKTDIDTYIDNVELYSVVDAYAINTVDSESATVSSDMDLAKEGETVTVNAAPKSGYANPVISATYVDGNDVVQNIAVAADGTFTMPAYAVTVTATAEPSDVAGYIINTRPYAGISVDGGAVVSTGRTGTYQFAVGTNGEHSVVITKDGYQTVSTTVTAADNGSTTLALNPNSGISYQEDFAYVDDDFSATKATISNGALVYGDKTKDSSEEITLPETVDVAGTVVTLRLKKGRIDRNCTVAFGAFSFYIPLGNVQYSNNKFDGVLTANEYSNIQLYIPTSDDEGHRPILYVDGVRYNTKDNSRQGARTVNTLYFKNNGNYPTITIDYIKVEKLASGNTEPVATVTIDGNATSYLKGTTVTIPAAAEGYEWHDANDNVVSAGDMVVNENLTLTAVAVTPAGPTATVDEVSYNQYEAANTAANDQDITAAKILVTVTGSIDTLGLKYYDAEAATWTDAKYVQNFEGLTNTNIVLGAIVPGLVDLTTSSFDAVIE